MRRALAPFLLLMSIGCSSDYDGSVDGVSYSISFDESYRRIERPHEHVFVPSDDDQPIVSIQIGNSSVGEDGPKCYATRDRYLTSPDGFLIGRDGEMMRGASVGVHHCPQDRPDKTLRCSAYFADGSLVESDHARLVGLCRRVSLP